MTATSADECCTRRRVIAVIRPTGRLCGIAEGAAEEVDGVGLEAETDVGVDGGGDIDVGGAEDFVDDEEFDALIQEEDRGRVMEVVESDLTESRSAEERL
ncbi:hypothetical protein [Kitasatospora sp. NBC_01300]|uniref:hypothetical protein n=1 Tax=Kitasatospora sp. NBC_01300 TaxID=2903574 RepID=UPI00352E43DA